MRSCLIILFLFFLFSILYSQSVENLIIDRYNSYGYSNPYELAYLKVNDKLFFSGDDIKFSLVVFNQYLEPSTELSKIAYIALINKAESFYKCYAFNLNDGVVNGTISLPIDMSSGNYQLIAYTQFMNNGDLDYLSYRIPIYIHDVEKTAKKIQLSLAINDKDHINFSDKKDQRVLIQTNELSKKVFVQIDLQENVKGTYYLISEGYNNIQFIAKTELDGEPYRFSISKDKLKGQFQKLILVDENYNLESCHYLFLKNQPNDQLDLNDLFAIKEKRVELKLSNDLISNIEINSPIFLNDSLSLFRRIYRDYYSIPSSISLDKYSYKELTSNYLLNYFSRFAWSKWVKILETTSNKVNVEYLPDQEIILSGNIVCDSNISDIAPIYVYLHSFGDGVDLKVLVDSSRKFHIPLLFPKDECLVYAKVFDENENDLSDRFKIEFTNNKLSYSHGECLEYVLLEELDGHIESRRNLKYALSRLEPLNTGRRYFWEDKKIDEVIVVADYYTFNDVEEFVEEVIQKVSIKNDKGEKSLRMYDVDNMKLFEREPLFIIDNEVVSGSNQIFELVIDSIKDFRLVYKNESLAKFGSPFSNGVIIITTKTATVPVKKEGKHFTTIYGYHESINNELSDSFNETLLLYSNQIDKNTIEIPKSRQTGCFDVLIESLTKEGNYRSTLKKFTIE